MVCRFNNNYNHVESQVIDQSNKLEKITTMI